MGKMGDLFIEELENMTDEEREAYERKTELEDIAVQEYLEQQKKLDGEYVLLLGDPDQVTSSLLTSFRRAPEYLPPP